MRIWDVISETDLASTHNTSNQHTTVEFFPSSALQLLIMWRPDNADRHFGFIDHALRAYRWA